MVGAELLFVRYGMILKLLKDGVLKAVIEKGCLLIELTLTAIIVPKIADGFLQKSRQTTAGTPCISNTTGNAKRLVNGLMRSE
jgi:hypothetical protein